jgi:hypothetical protein
MCARMTDKPEHVDRMQPVRNSVGHEDNLRMWGSLYISQTGRTAGGWIVNSWSELGAPYWRPRMHWFDKTENKFYHAYLDLDRRSMNLHSEDKEIEPERVSFIRKMTGKWELEWLQEQAGAAGRS